MRDQVVLISGGATGIGRGIAFYLGDLGAKVAICSRTQENLDKAVTELQQAGVDAMAHVCDIRKPDQVERTVGAVLQRYGQLDVLVNNAAGNFPALLKDLSYNGFRTVVDIDLNGTFNLTKACYSAWFAEHGGCIVNISAPFEGAGIPYQAHAAAAKAGVNSLTRTCAVEWRGQNIRVNAIEPGPVSDTEGMQRLNSELSVQTRNAVPACSPRDIGKAVAFLASDDARFISGQCLAVDSGSGVDLLKLSLAE